MGKLSINGKKKNGGVVNLVERLQKSFFTGRNNKSDVKEGHFVVVAVESDEPKRFVVSLRYLSHPRFQRLLAQSAEEFGFNQEGALTIHCCPNEIDLILADHKWHSSSSSSNNHKPCENMLQMY